MNNLFKIIKKQSFPIGLILILALARLIPHPPNFTPIVAVAIMSGYFFKNIYLSFATLIISMLLSDLFLGFYENMIYVYISLILTSFIFYKISEKINFTSSTVTSRKASAFPFNFCALKIFGLLLIFYF